jgi:hypothetical protein
MNYDNINIEKDFEQIEQEDDNNQINENELMAQYNNNNYINNNVDINELKDLSDNNNMNSQGFQNAEEEEYNDNELINENENIDYQNVNDNNNEINNNDEINNNNEEMLPEDEQNLINNLEIDESIKAYIIELQKKLNSLSIENEQLKMAGSELIDDSKNIINIKKQNNFLIEKIKELQIQNKKIGQELIKAKNKFRMQNNNNNNINNINIGPNNPKNKIEAKTEIIKLNSKINEYEIIIGQLKLEKQILVSKIKNLEKDHANELDLMTHYQNNELQSYKKIINELKNKEINNLNNLNINKKIYNNKILEDSKFFLDKINLLQQRNEKMSEEIFLLERENKNLKDQIDTNNLNIKYKDNIIQTLNDRIKYFSNEYNRQVQSLDKNNNQSQFQIEQLFKENDKLMKENQELNIGIKLLNEKVKESLVILNNKNDRFNNTIRNYKSKLYEYKQKIVILKKRVDELLTKRKYNNNYMMRNDNNSCHSNLNYYIQNKKNGSFSYGKLNYAY